ncbi:MAG: hypothetical protein H7Y01_10070 [Ferruginibacter sp.]|nr:hypothetical protein [Chitinophagaceae bacterium]
MIIFDHLISETDQPEKKDTYIPDGDFEGFKWLNGQWVHVNKVFDFKLEDGGFPKEATILDDAGNIDEKQLEEAYNTLGSLQAHPQVQKFVGWIATKPPGFQPTSPRYRGKET